MNIEVGDKYQIVNNDAVTFSIGECVVVTEMGSFGREDWIEVQSVETGRKQIVVALELGEI